MLFTHRVAGTIRGMRCKFITLRSSTLFVEKDTGRQRRGLAGVPHIVSHCECIGIWAQVCVSSQSMPHPIFPINMLPVASGKQESLNPKQLEKENFLCPGIASSKILPLCPQPDVSFISFELKMITLLQIFGKRSHSTHLIGALILWCKYCYHPIATK